MSVLQQIGKPSMILKAALLRVAIKVNPKRFWKYVSSQSKVRHLMGGLLKSDSSLTADDCDTANTLNNRHYWGMVSPLSSTSAILLLTIDVFRCMQPSYTYACVHCIWYRKKTFLVVFSLGRMLRAYPHLELGAEEVLLLLSQWQLMMFGNSYVV